MFRNRAGESFICSFLALNVAFLLGTALWFRLDHASPSSRRWRRGRRPRRSLRAKDEGDVASKPSSLDDDGVVLVDELRWQYSLRSNLLLFGCAQSAYLLYVGHVEFLIGLFAFTSVLNVVTDALYMYERAPLWREARVGHRIAAALICSVYAVCFFSSSSASRS